MRFDFHRRAPGMARWKMLFFWTLVEAFLYYLGRVLYRLRLEGRENVPETGPLIYVCNHQSHFDPPLVGVLVADRPSAFLARASLFKFKPFAWLIRTLNAIPLHRGQGSGGALRAAVAELEAGRCVLLFPEGTRTPDGAIGRFKPGFTFLAKRTGATVVPIAVEGARNVWPRERRLPHLRGWLALKVGRAIEAEELLADGADAAVDRIRTEIETMRQELRADLDRRRRR
jgi:1-acyl-sn-glycerol-3-phosphate acyltransferase